MATTKKAARTVARGHGLRYTAEARREALPMLDGDKTMAALSEELGASIGTLTQWKLKAAAGAARGGDGRRRGECDS